MRTGVILKDVSLEVFLFVFGLQLVFVLEFIFVFVFVFKVESYTRMSFLRNCLFFPLKIAKARENVANKANSLLP